MAWAEPELRSCGVVAIVSGANDIKVPSRTERSDRKSINTPTLFHVKQCGEIVQMAEPDHSLGTIYDPQFLVLKKNLWE